LSRNKLFSPASGASLSWAESEAWLIIALTRALLDAEVDAAAPVRD
jgi:hypothetical protein